MWREGAGIECKALCCTDAQQQPLKTQTACQLCLCKLSVCIAGEDLLACACRTISSVALCLTCFAVLLIKCAHVGVRVAADDRSVVPLQHDEVQPVGERELGHPALQPRPRIASICSVKALTSQLSLLACLLRTHWVCSCPQQRVRGDNGHLKAFVPGLRARR